MLCLKYLESFKDEPMASNWQDMTQLTGDTEIVIERVRLVAKDIAIEGSFELPPLARLEAEDQTFVVAFVRCQGSIKQMERYFGVSYPTIKNRLNRIASRLEFVEIQEAPVPPSGRVNRQELLDRLKRGEVTLEQVLGTLQEC
jgi:hypothetical protein